MMDAYTQFLERKRAVDPMTGMADVGELPAFMFPHQRDIVAWALRRGRSAVFAGTGLGKTAMELVWGGKVAEYTGKPVLIFAPLAVVALSMVTHRCDGDASCLLAHETQRLVV